MAENNPVMLTGKHRGYAVRIIPTDYLQWMVRERHPQKWDAETELKRRGGRIRQFIKGMQ